MKTMTSNYEQHVKSVFEKGFDNEKPLKEVLAPAVSKLIILTMKDYQSDFDCDITSIFLMQHSHTKDLRLVKTWTTS